jgi:hypothetical protein
MGERMIDDEHAPQLTNSGLTDPAQPPAAPSSATTGTASTPFGVTGSTSGVAIATATSCTNSAIIVATALEEAAQAIIQADVPLAMVEELIAAVQSPAVADVLKARVRLIVDHGHTAASDDFLPIGWLPMEARKAFEDARDLMNAEHRDLVEVRAKMVEGIAFGLAALDRLDRAMKAGER